MLDIILAIAKKFIPAKLFKALQPGYHFALGYLATLIYRNPSEKMIVVGVTGTTGKTTIVYLLAKILKSVGMKTGYLSTAFISDGEREILNDKKMTMLGRFWTQKMLRRMVKNKCKIAIIETTSQGIEQFRHRFINYDILIFTGLYPEHIEAHGGFENYKKAKGALFAHLKNCRKKNVNRKEIIKTIIANADDAHAGYFLDFWAERKILFGIRNHESGIENGSEMIRAENINSSAEGSQFTVSNIQFRLNLLGKFNVENALSAISAARALNVPLEKIKEGLEKVTGIPGRLEKIDVGQGFSVIVDYAYEPNAVAKLYETVNTIPHDKIIHVLGSAGGGRDKARRPKLGKLAGDNADYAIVTNEDPYDEDPLQIINEVAAGIEIKKEGESFWKILNRREAIKKALALAGDDDIVLITGKGSEQAICVADGKKIPWDDRKVIREVLQEL
jgi:UDP-N-acetylmuramoyl-L-alanyl-D-glutamate--2,6-diaminopimelate ligase